MALLAQGFDFFIGLGANIQQTLPLGNQGGIGGGQVAIGFDKDRVAVAHKLPRFFGGKAQEGCHPAQHGLGDLVQRGLGAAACQAVGLGGVQAVFEYVEVEAAQELAAEVLQLGHHGVEFVHLVVLQNAALQLGGVAEGVAVHLEQLLGFHGLGGVVKIADVGQHKAQSVADAAVGVDYARQDFVVNRQVARVVGTGYPQTDDFRTQLVADRLGRDHVAYRFAHLTALAVDRKAVGEQAFVRCAAIGGARQQQRAVEPATVLVMAFQIQVGRVLQQIGMAAAQHVHIGGARVKPHVQNVVDFGVVGGVLRAQNVFCGGFRPGLDTALLYHGSSLVYDFHGAWMQLTTVFVQEEGQRYAPVTLAADTPVWAVSDHVVQARFPVGWVEAGLLNSC